jgi:hypothetical protein
VRTRLRLARREEIEIDAEQQLEERTVAQDRPNPGVPQPGLFTRQALAA